MFHGGPSFLKERQRSFGPPMLPMINVLKLFLNNLKDDLISPVNSYSKYKKYKKCIDMVFNPPPTYTHPLIAE